MINCKLILKCELLCFRLFEMQKLHGQIMQIEKRMKKTKHFIIIEWINKNQWINENKEEKKTCWTSLIYNDILYTHEGVIM